MKLVQSVLQALLVPLVLVVFQGRGVLLACQEEKEKRYNLGLDPDTECPCTPGEDAQLFTILNRCSGGILTSFPSATLPLLMSKPTNLAKFLAIMEFHRSRWC